MATALPVGSRQPPQHHGFFRRSIERVIRLPCDTARDRRSHTKLPATTTVKTDAAIQRPVCETSVSAGVAVAACVGGTGGEGKGGAT